MTPARTWAYLGPAMMLAGLMLVVTFAPRAHAAADHDRPTATHIILECKPNQPCRERGRPVGKTACDMDITGVAITAEKGTRLQCVRVKR
jgi:hypothetical protein